MQRLLCVLSLMIGVLGPVPSRAENWPCWRGPTREGHSAETGIPIRWDGASGENVLWKVEVPGEGHGSPIVWNDRLFLVTCLLESRERQLLCYDTADGRLLWRQTVVHCPLETKHTLNSFASTTPATDGRLVYATFLEVDGSSAPALNVGSPRDCTPGQMAVAAYDFDGKQQWIARPGTFASVHGFCSNPVLFEDLVIVNGDHDGESYIVALNRQTGETVWKAARPHQTRSYVTPIVKALAGREQLVFSGSRCVVSLNPRDGSPIWNVEGPTEQFVASPVDDGEKVYLVGGFPTHHVMAIRPDGTGDVTDTHVAWHVTTAKCYVPSPLLSGHYLYVTDDRGTANCFDTQTGERLWQDRMGEHFSTSLVSAQGRVYFTSDDGTTKVVEPGPELTVIQENTLGERTYASPAISNGSLYLRGERHLFRIGARPADPH